MNNTGFSNEDDLKKSLNDKNFKELNDNLKNNIILKLSNDIDNDTIISCSKIGGTNKADLGIKIKNRVYLISVKKGTGNSLHQEPISTFIDYIKKINGCNEEIIKTVKYYIWGDNTYDGTGPIADRVNAYYLKKHHSDILTKVQTFFNLNKNILLDRFIKYGVKRESKYYAQFMYYGTVSKGIIRPIDNIVKYLSKDTKPILSVGGLTFQAWNRNINGGDKSEKKRGVIQLKWGNIGKELSNVPE